MQFRYTGRVINRRELLGLLGLSPGLLRGDTSPLDKLTATWAPKSIQNQSAKYRADAIVSFVGINIVSRSSVGTANIKIDVSSAAQEAKTVALWFAAGSAPERARGLNRLGHIHEVVVERGANVLESAYFGLMTSSEEESFAQAKAALGANGADAVPYTAVEGSAAGTSCAYRLYQIKLPTAYNFSRFEDMIGQVKGLLARNEIEPSKKESTASETPRTFLYAVREAMRSQLQRVNAPFLFNGKPYKLHVEKSADTKMGQQLVTRNVTAKADRVMRVTGTIHNLEKGSRTPFKLWFEPGRELPLRFEYKAKSYLNLAFEYVPA